MDRVRDGRDLMENDEVGMLHPAARFTFSETIVAQYRRLQQVANREASERMEREIPAPDHPNYRYPQERTGDSTV